MEKTKVKRSRTEDSAAKNVMREHLKEFAILEARVNAGKSAYLESLARTVQEHKKSMSAVDFRDLTDSFFILHMLNVGGSDYFSWTPKAKIVKDRKSFNIEAEAKGKFYVTKYDGRNMMFSLGKLGRHCTDRRRVESTTITYSKEDDVLHYSYMGQRYHGFGALNGEYRQSFDINLKDDTITGLESSHVRHYDWFTYFHYLR